MISFSLGCKKWIKSKSWKSFRNIQIKSFESFFSSDCDLIVSAGTASGKTEAAFLPVVSDLSLNGVNKVGCLYIAPLRSLINDQILRISDLCSYNNIDAFAWHSDIEYNSKLYSYKNHNGIMLTTPESLESLFLSSTFDISFLFKDLKYIIIDELHFFLSADRGTHLSSLLSRLNFKIEKSPRRIGLSATIGDKDVACRWLNSEFPERVIYISDRSSVDINIKLNLILSKSSDNGDGLTFIENLSESLFDQTKSGKNIVFSESRRFSEALVDALKIRNSNSNNRTSYYPHHGSLSKEIRFDIESKFKNQSSDMTVVSTSSLELGIDIGDVGKVFQIGLPKSVSSLRQRVGRSGRRENQKSNLILYNFQNLTNDNISRLNLNLFYSLSCCSLMLDGYVESFSDYLPSLSVFVHQILCTIKSFKNISSKDLELILLSSSYFKKIGIDLFNKVLEKLVLYEYLSKQDNRLILSKNGVSFFERNDIYSVFSTPIEFSVLCNGEILGSLPISGLKPLGIGDHILFAGRRWVIIGMDMGRNFIHVDSSDIGQPPSFQGEDYFVITDIVMDRMLNLYNSTDLPFFCSSLAKKYIISGRREFVSSGLFNSCLVSDKKSFLLFPWVGTRRLVALSVAMSGEGVPAEVIPYGLKLKARDASEIIRVLELVRNESSIRFETWLNRRKAFSEGKFDSDFSEQFRMYWWSKTISFPSFVSDTCDIILSRI